MINCISKMGPWASKMRPWSSKGTLLSAGVDFGAFFCVFGAFLGCTLVPFWGHFGIIFASIFRRRFWRCFGSILGSIREAFWGHFGDFFEPRGHSERKSRFSKKPYKTCRFLMILRVGGAQTMPFWLPGATFGTSKNDVDFCIDF